VGDDPVAVNANRALLAGALPPDSAVQWLNQVHGARVIPAGRDGTLPEADASFTAEPGIACAVMTADCLPALFCTRAGDRAAAAHAGWRGLVGGVLEATVAAMGAVPAEIMAWLGPAIGPAAFEVGPEVREAFLAAAGGDRQATERCFLPSATRPGHYLADLYGLARIRLHLAGIGDIYGGDFCTFDDFERFYSYRRDGETGRMASLVMLRPG
jgi:YfiH family protein